MKFRVLLFFVLMLAAQTVFAKPIHVTIDVANLKNIKTSEFGNDEIYFTITEFFQKRLPIETRTPEFPHHWVVKKGLSLKKNTIWKGTINENTERELLIAVVEEDHSPRLNPDDLIGLVELKLVNKKGTLSIEWKLPNTYTRFSGKVKNKSKRKFKLFGDSAEYELELELISK